MMNQAIRRVSRAEDLILVDSFHIFTNRDGYAKSGTTADGMHLTTDSYKRWSRAIMNGVTEALEKRGLSCKG